MNTPMQAVTYYNLSPVTGEPVEVPLPKFKGVIPVKTSHPPGRVVITNFFGWDQPEYFTYVHQVGGPDPYAIVAKFHSDNATEAMRQHDVGCQTRCLARR
jgi:hypothetical protein